MPLFGAHMSIVGGCHNALLSAMKYGCGSVQLFTKSNNQWAAKELLPEDVQLFRQTRRQSGLRYLMAHDCYLINLASPNQKLYRKSIEAFTIELQRAELLGLHYLVTHPGSPLDAGEEFGLARVATALDEVHARCPSFRVKVLLETTAGQGNTLGHRFEHLARIIERVKEPKRLGVCFDTCHVFAAGYPLWPPANYEETVKEFHKVIGMPRLHAFHINDSLKPQGSRVDRHAHIGRGEIGLEPFRLLVNDPRFRNRPMVLETPKESPDGEDMDAVNLATLRSLVQPESAE
jgi:deoxyribonuclease IV